LKLKAFEQSQKYKEGKSYWRGNFSIPARHLAPIIHLPAIELSWSITYQDC